MAWHGMAWCNAAWQADKWHGMAWHAAARHPIPRRSTFCAHLLPHSPQVLQPLLQAKQCSMTWHESS